MHAIREPNVQVLATPRADGPVRRPGDAEHAAHRAGDEIARLPVGPRPGPPERRERDLDERRVGRGDVGAVEHRARRAVPAAASRSRGRRARPGAGRRPRRRPSRGRRRPSACRPRATSRAGHRGRRRSASSHGRAGRRAPEAGDRGAALGQQLAGEAALSSVKLDDPQALQRSSACVGHVVTSFPRWWSRPRCPRCPGTSWQSPRGGSTPAGGSRRRRGSREQPRCCSSHDAMVVRSLPTARSRAW